MMTPKYQVLMSREADFGELTWTFELQPHNYVAAGEFAIVPTEEFTKAMQRLALAETLLKRLLDGKDITPDAYKFFDPDPEF